MGRRALPKIDPKYDLSGHLFTFEQLPSPWNAQALFGRVAPLEVEVGSGKGLFLRTAAAASPDVNFLGIEIAHKYARFAAAGLFKTGDEGKGLANARMVDGNALRVFCELLPDNSLQAVHVYFPDPWWKKRHRKRRVMNEFFVTQIERTLQPGGALHFWTDVEEYFQVTLELLAAQSGLKGPQAVPEEPAEHPMAYRTHFERRMRLSDQPVYRSKFVK
jgi:tRNA (guanine-N7-)-methyltransferase